MSKFNLTEYQNKLLEAIANGTYEDFLNKMSDDFKDYNQTINFKIPLKFVNKSNNVDPEYAKEGDSGFDIRANLETPIVLKPLERFLIPTGLFFELPKNTELQIRPRSGLSVKNGVTVLNTPGTVDEQYTGEVKIILINLSNENFTVNNGDRIAQGVLASVTGERIVELSKIDEITIKTERGSDGFGSTGKK